MLCCPDTACSERIHLDFQKQIFGSAQGSSMELKIGRIKLMLSSVRTRLCQMLLASLLRCSTGWLALGLLGGCCLSFVFQSQRILFPSHQHRLASRTSFVVSFHCTEPSSSSKCFKAKEQQEKRWSASTPTPSPSSLLPLASQLSELPLRPQVHLLHLLQSLQRILLVKSIQPRLGECVCVCGEN